MLSSRILFKKLTSIPKYNCHRLVTFGNLSNSNHSGHHTDEPYAVKHHHPYPDEAYAFGRKPGTPLEGWEIITAATYIICFGLLISDMGDNESFKVICYHVDFF